MQPLVKYLLILAVLTISIYSALAITVNDTIFITGNVSYIIINNMDVNNITVENSSLYMDGIYYNLTSDEPVNLTLTAYNTTHIEFRVDFYTASTLNILLYGSGSVLLNNSQLNYDGTSLLSPITSTQTTLALTSSGKLLKIMPVVPYVPPVAEGDTGPGGGGGSAPYQNVTIITDEETGNISYDLNCKFLFDSNLRVNDTAFLILDCDKTMVGTRYGYEWHTLNGTLLDYGMGKLTQHTAISYKPTGEMDGFVIFEAKPFPAKVYRFTVRNKLLDLGGMVLIAAFLSLIVGTTLGIRKLKTVYETRKKAKEAKKWSNSRLS